MTPEAKQRIVLIQAEFDHGKPSIGTGFRLRPGLILTSQHVVQRCEDGVTSKAKQIQVARFRGHGEKPEIADAEEIWAGESELPDEDKLEALDVALLKDELDGSALSSSGFFAALCKGEHGSDIWDAAGFPSTSLRESIFPVEIGGKVGAYSKHDGFLDLTNDRPSPVDEQGKTLNLPWAGMSGAPVFFSQGRFRGYLCGVIRRSYDSLPSTLFAVPMPALLLNQNFRCHLDLDQEQAQYGKLIDLLRNRLKAYQDLQPIVAAWVPAWQDAFDHPTDRLDRLLAAMLVYGSLAEVSDALAVLAYASEPPTVALKEVAALILALIAGRAAPPGQHERGLEVAAAAANLAEVALAYRDGRLPRFIEVLGDRPRAQLRAPLSKVEAGFGQPQRVQDQLDLLVEHYLFSVLGKKPWQLPADADDLDVLPDDLKHEVRVDQLRRRFRRMTSQLGAAPYVVADWQFREKLGSEAEPFLDKLNELFPEELRQVTLTGEIRRIAEENDLLEPFLRLVGVFPE